MTILNCYQVYDVYWQNPSKAIAETFEDTDEDSVDFLDDQASVQAKNNLEVHHVQGLLCDDNSLSSHSNPYSQRKDRKQDTKAIISINGSFAMRMNVMTRFQIWFPGANKNLEILIKG